MEVRLIELENYLSGKKVYKEVGAEQHIVILARIANDRLPVVTRIIRKRSL